MGKLRERYSNWIRNWKGIQGFNDEYVVSARIGKNYCPYCRGLLQVKRKTQIVNSESEEARKFDFSMHGGSQKGNIRFTWDVYYCENCDKELSIADIRRYEKELKRIGGNADFDEIRMRHGKKKRMNPVLGFLISCAFLFAVILLIYAVSHFFS